MGARVLLGVGTAFARKPGSLTRRLNILTTDRDHGLRFGSGAGSS